jgi:hypothetical protein
MGAIGPARNVHSTVVESSEVIPSWPLRRRQTLDHVERQTIPTPRASLRDAMREVLYGLTGHEFARHAIAARASLETLFMVSCVGDMIGLPVMPPYYSLRLLPFVVPQVATWKRRVLRERDFSDNHDFELHGV